jgi:hypothetical protein
VGVLTYTPDPLALAFLSFSLVDAGVPITPGASKPKRQIASGAVLLLKVVPSSAQGITRAVRTYFSGAGGVSGVGGMTFGCGVGASGAASIVLRSNSTVPMRSLSPV